MVKPLEIYGKIKRKRNRKFLAQTEVFSHLLSVIGGFEFVKNASLCEKKTKA